MNQPAQPPQEMQININLKDKKPFECDGIVDGKTCGNNSFVQYFHLFYVSPVECGVPNGMTVHQTIWVCTKCRKGYYGAKPQ